MDGDTGSRTCPHQHAECLQEEQDREGQRQSGNSQRTDSLTDKDTVYNIIQSIYHRPDHRRDSILQQQAAHFLVLQPSDYFICHNSSTLILLYFRSI